MKIWIFYLIVMNLLAFLLFGADKKRAQHRKQRMSERTLFLVAFLGGSLGAWAGMQIFRHKTKKTIFRFIIPVLFFLQTTLIIFGMFRESLL